MKKIAFLLLMQFCFFPVHSAEEVPICQSVVADDLVGNWYSNEFVEEYEYNQITHVNRQSDGTMSIKFLVQKNNGSELIVTEKLKWYVDGCKYIAVTTQRNGKPFEAFEVYTVLKFDQSSMKYRHEQDGVVYELFRSQ